MSEDDARGEAKNEIGHEFNLPVEHLWENIRKEVSKQLEPPSEALKKTGELNPKLNDTVDRTNFIQLTTSTENPEILRHLMELFSEKKLNHVFADVLGYSMSG